MGKTSFSGPTWGAKQLLWSFSAGKIDFSTAAQTIAGIVVPSGEDWFVTDLHVFRDSTHSTATVIALVDDSTTVADVALTSSGGKVAGSTRPTPDGGEYAGTQVASGSSLTLTLQNGNSSVASTGISAWVYGFPRWLQSDTRGL